MLRQALLGFRNSENSRPKIKQEPKDDTEITSQQVDGMFGRVLEFQFLVHPKQEPIEVKTESETITLSGEVVDPFDEDWVAVSRNVCKDKNFSEDKYFCKKCNKEFPLKKHELHREYVKLLNKKRKSTTEQSNYSCKECDITFNAPKDAIRHLFAHDRAIFDCNFCVYVGKTLLDLKVHLTSSHCDVLNSKSNQIVQCTFCDFKSNHRLTMRKHINAKHRPSAIKCKKCDEYWPDEDHTIHEKIKHITRKEITTENPFVCKECNAKFVETDKIYEHLKIHDDIGYYCNFCSFNTDEQIRLEKHKEQVHPDQTSKDVMEKELSSDDYACSQCNRFWPDKSHKIHLRMLEIEERGVSDTQPYRCSGCHKDITDIKRVYFHLSLGCKKLQCDKCSYMTLYPYSMNLHNINKHRKPDQVKKMFACDKCDYKTHAVKYLASHQRTHMDEIDKVYYQCNKCTFKTVNKSYLQRHKHKLHEQPQTEKKNINCPECPYVTNDIMNLQKHKNDCHSNSLYSCSCCIYQTTNRKYFERHRITKHLTSKKNKMKTKYMCELCGIKYVLQQTLQRHKIKIHNIHPVDAKKYTCDICNYETIIKSDFAIHLHRRHQEHKQKMYCANCDYSTFIKTNLVQHMVKHADPSKMKMHKCTMCSFTTKRPHTLRHHIKTHDVA